MKTVVLWFVLGRGWTGCGRLLVPSATLEHGLRPSRIDRFALQFGVGIYGNVATTSSLNEASWPITACSTALNSRPAIRCDSPVRLRYWKRLPITCRSPPGYRGLTIDLARYRLCRLGRASRFRSGLSRLPASRGEAVERTSLRGHFHSLQRRKHGRLPTNPPPESAHPNTPAPA